MTMSSEPSQAVHLNEFIAYLDVLIEHAQCQKLAEAAHLRSYFLCLLMTYPPSLQDLVPNLPPEEQEFMENEEYWVSGTRLTVEQSIQSDYVMVFLTDMLEMADAELENLQKAAEGGGEVCS